MHDVIIPKLGMGTTEVEILEWYVEIGEQVAVGAALVEVETEKLTTTIEADAAGTLTEYCFAEGDTAEVGAVVCRIDTTQGSP